MATKNQKNKKNRTQSSRSRVSYTSPRSEGRTNRQQLTGYELRKSGKISTGETLSTNWNN